jgi:hypothetical protein
VLELVEIPLVVVAVDDALALAYFVVDGMAFEVVGKESSFVVEN